MSSTKLYESLFILHKCNSVINRFWQIIEGSQDRIKEIEDFAILFTYYIKMESVSFLDEFNNGFYKSTEIQYSERISQIRKITAPVIKRIKKWKDLEKFRNNIIAHPWRQNGKFVIPSNRHYNIPRNWFEVGVLVNLMNYTWQLIRAEFEKEFGEAIIYIARINPTPKEPTNYENLNADHLQMADEVGQICERLEKKYYLTIMAYKLERKV